MAAEFNPDQQNKGTTRPCPVCLTSSSVHIGDLKYALFDDNPLGSAFRVVACKKCGFVFNDTLAKPNDFDTYYQQNAYYFSAATPGSGGDSPADRKRYQETVDILERHMFDKESFILDVGSGKGGQLKSFQQNGFKNLFAIDMVEPCIRYIQSYYQIQAEVGTITNIPFTKRNADVFVLSHLLEHVFDLTSALQHLKQRLSGNGLIYAEVPDAAAYQGHLLRDFYFEHINHFDINHLKSLFQSQGFECLEAGEKFIEVGQSTRVKCIYGVFRTGQKSEVIPNFDLLKQMKRIFDQTTLDPSEGLAQLSETQKQIYVWGISQHTQLMLGMSPLKNCSIKGLIDQDPQKQQKTINGLPIYPPKFLQNAGKDDAVVLANGPYTRQMQQYLQAIDFKGDIYVIL